MKLSYELIRVRAEAEIRTLMDQSVFEIDKNRDYQQTVYTLQNKNSNFERSISKYD